MGDSGDDGPAIDAGLVSGPLAIDDKAGVLYVTSGMVVRAIDLRSGIISTVAGGGMGLPYPGGRALDARFYSIRGIAADGQGKLYIADNSTTLFRPIWLRASSTPSCRTMPAPMEARRSQGTASQPALATSSTWPRPRAAAWWPGSVPTESWTRSPPGRRQVRSPSTRQARPFSATTRNC